MTPIDQLDEARAELSRLEAVVVDARSVLNDATTAIAIADAEVLAITGQIEEHDGGPGIEALAARRSIADARVIALNARAKAKVTALSEAQAAVKAASLVVDQHVLAIEAQLVKDGDADLKGRLIAFALACVEARAEIQAHVHAANKAGASIQSLNGKVRGHQLPLSEFDTLDQTTDVFTAALVHAAEARALAGQAELQKVRDEARERGRALARERGEALAREQAAAASAPTVLSLTFTPPPQDQATVDLVNE